MTFSITLRFVVPILALVLLVPCRALGGERHALLVGVAGYPQLAEGLRLQGPRNDVQLMRSVLEEQAFPATNIRVLADGIEGARPATRSAILKELRALAGRTGKGDFVYLHFSGHGSQQPSPGGPSAAEPDALDELFLPYDVGRWEERQGAVENAIVDDEIGIAVDAIRKGGTFVWAVFDSCHSGTLTRAYSVSGERVRRLPPEALGIPTERTAAAARSALRTRGGLATAPPLEPEAAGEGEGLGLGGLVTFFAAQTFETTPESPLPQGVPEQKPFGLFTFTLAQTLARAPGISYRQAGHQILQVYAAAGRNAPTPLFAGTDLDAPLFAAKGGQRPAQWPLQRRGRRLTLRAGLLHGVSEGAVLALLPEAGAGKERILGYAEVTKTDLLQSGLKTIAYSERPAVNVRLLPARAYGRLERSALRLHLTVARPPAGTGEEQRRLARLLQALGNGSAAPDRAGLHIRWVAADQDADLRLFLREGKVWLLPPTADLIRTGPMRSLSIGLEHNDERLTAILRESLQTIAKAVNLLRLATLSAPGATAGALEIEAVARRADTNERVDLHGQVPKLHDGDLIRFRLRNGGRKPLDVTALFIDSAYGIVPWVPEPGEVNRIESGGEFTFVLEVASSTESGEPSTLGKERMLVLAVEAEAGQPLADFTFLAQPRLPLTRGRRGEDELRQLLTQAGFGGPATTTRGGVRPRNRTLSRAQFRVFGWETVQE